MHQPNGFFQGFLDRNASPRDQSDHAESQEEQHNAGFDYATAVDSSIVASMSNSFAQLYGMNMNTMQSAEPSSAYRHTVDWNNQVASERSAVMQGSLYDPNAASFVPISAEHRYPAHRFVQGPQENYAIATQPAITYPIPIDFSTNGYPFQAPSESSNHPFSMYASEKIRTIDNEHSDTVNGRPVSALETWNTQRVGLNEILDDASGSTSRPMSITSSPSPRMGDAKGKRVSSGSGNVRKRCSTCGTSDSPEWRKGADSSKPLCNACGLRHSRKLSRTRRKEEMERRAVEVAANGGVIPAGLRDQLFAERQRKRAKSLSSVMPTVNEAKSGNAGLRPPATVKDAVLRPLSLSTSSKDNDIRAVHHEGPSGSSQPTSTLAEVPDANEPDRPNTPLSTPLPPADDHVQEIDPDQPLSSIDHQSDPTLDTIQ